MDHIIWTILYGKLQIFKNCFFFNNYQKSITAENYYTLKSVT